MIGRYLTPEAIQLGLYGLAAGSLAGLGWRIAGRLSWGGAPFVLAVVVAARVADRTDSPRWNATAAAGAVVTLLAALGAARLLANPAVGWRWVGAASLVSAAGIWAGVPETGPALLVAGTLTGLLITAVLSGARWAPTAGVGAAAVLAWAALSGAAGNPWAAIGGSLCVGVAPWFIFSPLRRAPSWGWQPGPWWLGAHTLLVVLAARWIGVARPAGWGRVAILAAAGVAVALSTWRRA